MSAQALARVLAQVLAQVPVRLQGQASIPLLWELLLVLLGASQAAIHYGHVGSNNHVPWHIHSENTTASMEPCESHEQPQALLG